MSDREARVGALMRAASESTFAASPLYHVLAADGVFGAEGTFIACPPVPESSPAT